jgi:hypothetical protein
MTQVDSVTINTLHSLIKQVETENAQGLRDEEVGRIIMEEHREPS